MGTSHQIEHSSEPDRDDAPRLGKARTRFDRLHSICVRKNLRRRLNLKIHKLKHDIVSTVIMTSEWPATDPNRETPPKSDEEDEQLDLPEPGVDVPTGRTHNGEASTDTTLFDLVLH